MTVEEKAIDVQTAAARVQRILSDDTITAGSSIPRRNGLDAGILADKVIHGGTQAERDTIAFLSESVAEQKAKTARAPRSDKGTKRVKPPAPPAAAPAGVLSAEQAERIDWLAKEMFERHRDAKIYEDKRVAAVNAFYGYLEELQGKEAK